MQKIIVSRSKGCYFDCNGRDVTGKTFAKGSVLSKQLYCCSKEIGPFNKNLGPITRFNLIKQSSVGWKWIVGLCYTVICSVEQRGKHYYSLNVHCNSGIKLEYLDRKTEPRLRPYSRGELELHSIVGQISFRNRIHNVYDEIFIGQH